MIFNNNPEKRAEKLQQKALENQRNHIYKEMVAKEKLHKKEKKTILQINKI